jgi:hypothetical protein
LANVKDSTLVISASIACLKVSSVMEKLSCTRPLALVGGGVVRETWRLAKSTLWRVKSPGQYGTLRIVTERVFQQERQTQDWDAANESHSSCSHGVFPFNSLLTSLAPEHSGPK